MYYLADFAFENISDKALRKIYDNSLSGKKSYNFTPKQSVILPTDSEVVKARKLKKNSNLSNPEVGTLNKKLTSYAKDPTSKTTIISTRKIGTKLERTGMSAFPNSQPKGFKRFIKGTKIGALNLIPYVAAPLTLGAGLGVVNKLRGKTWTGKDK